MTFNIVALGASAGPRQSAFAAACQATLGTAPHVISYDQVLDQPDLLGDALSEQSYLWIDSPHQDAAAIRALYLAGASKAEAMGYPVLTAAQLDDLPNGHIGSPAQFYFGLKHAVVEACKQAQQSGARASVSPQDVACAFDKTAASLRLEQLGVPHPETLGAPTGFDQLADVMQARRVARVFVKLRHGSAAAGMIALARNGPDWRAVTTATQTANGSYRSSRQLQKLGDLDSIRSLIDALAPLGLHVERWLPKIGIGQKAVDVRCVVVDGETIFPVMRASHHPMTNLHLGGARSAPDALIAAIGPQAWSAALASVRATAKGFSSCKSVGIDLAILAGGKRHAVLEVNAFGDFVKDVFIDGLSPYQMVLKTLQSSSIPGHAA